MLSNSRCLGEGVDVRAIDCVGFIDPRKSTIDIVQAVGRAIRKSDKEKIGTVLIPVFIDESTAEDPEDPSDVSENGWLTWPLEVSQVERGVHEVRVQFKGFGIAAAPVLLVFLWVGLRLEARALARYFNHGGTAP